jgi:hypothetical protein
MVDADLQWRKTNSLLGAAARKKDLIVRIAVSNYKLQEPLFGRTKPNCAIVSIAAEGAGLLSQLSNEEGK